VTGLHPHPPDRREEVTSLPLQLPQNVASRFTATQSLDKCLTALQVAVPYINKRHRCRGAATHSMTQGKTSHAMGLCFALDSRAHCVAPRPKG
jgi:hypothetical protein